MGKLLLLSIGINNYLNPLPPLDYCAADAKLIYDTYSQINCEFKQLLVDEKATKSEILKRIQDIERIIRDEDYFIFSFAGHGFAISDTKEGINSKNTFICPYDFDYNYREISAISLNEVNEIIKSLKAKSKLVFFDACHSGGALRKISPNLRDIEISKLFEILGDNSGTCIFTACDSHESALESSEIMHGFFTHSLIESLKELGKQGDYALYTEVYNLVDTKVKEATNNEQHPQVKCNTDDFKLLTLPETGTFTKKEIDIDTTIIPTPYFNKGYESIRPQTMEELKKGTIQLIQENRFIELDKLFKSTIDSIYKKIATPDIPYSTNRKDAIPFYETCREYLKPLVLLSNYDIEYFNSKCLMNNLDYIFEFEELCWGKSGDLATVEIPLVLEAEFIFQVITKAYEKRNFDVLKEISQHKINYHGRGRNTPFIYHDSFWTPEIFQRNADTFLKYLFNEKMGTNDIFNKKFIEHMNEICLLFDCYSITKEAHDFHPTFYALNDFHAPDRVTSKLENGELNELIKNLFSLEIKEFIQIMIDRLNMLKKMYAGFEYRNFSFSEEIKRLEILKQ